MPSWLQLLLVIAGFVVWTALLAAGVTGSWRVFWVAGRQFGLILLGLALPAALVLLGLFMFGS